MYPSTAMPFGDSALISLMGLATVFLCLAALALAVMLFSKVFSAAGNARPQLPATAEETKLDEQAYAVLLCVLSEEARLPLEKFQITSIRELD